MYENITYEIIMKRMLARVIAQDANLDTREGSIIYNALAPCAVELQNMYIELDNILTESFADTATREYLIKRCKERGITPKSATYAVRQGVFTPSMLDVPVGTRFSLNTLNYAVTAKISDGVYQLTCETAGTAGNRESGALIPIDYVNGLQTAQLTTVLIPAEDDEETEVLRARYFASFDSQAFGGNIADYKEKVNTIDGVGGVKVYPVWAGGGTVKLEIISSDYTMPTSTLIDKVQTLIDPTQNAGEGLGIAPIGHVVTVMGCGQTTVNIETEITFQSGWSWDAIKSYVYKTVDEYFAELAKDWADEDNLVVRISQLETRILSLTGVLDIGNTKLNGSTSNLQLDASNIPVRGDVNVV